MDNLTKMQRTYTMQSVHSKDTKPEIMLRKALWHKGIRYRKNYKELIGKPDIVITRCKIAIFVDGDFWHGKNMDAIEKRIQSHRTYWLPKIRRNRERDAEVNDALTEQGWIVLRFWESDIKKQLEQCVAQILEYVPYHKSIEV